MQTTSHRQSDPVSSNPDLSEEDRRLAEASSSARSDCMREFFVEELRDSEDRGHYEEFLSVIDSKNFSSFTHDSKTQDGETIETTVVRSGSSTLTIQMRAPNNDKLELNSGFSAIVTLQKADGSEVRLSVGDDETGVAFESPDLRLLQLLRTYAHQVARQAKTEEVHSNLKDLENIEPSELQDITFLSEQDFRERFPGETPPSPLPAVAQARYRDMDVYVYQSRHKDSPDGVCYQLLASQDVMKFTGDLAEIKSSSSSLVRIEQGESSSLARLYQDVLRYDEKAEQTMKVLAEAEKLVIESLQKYAREVEQREATAAADENYFKQIQRQFYVSTNDKDLGTTRLLKVTLPGGGSTVSAVRIESESGDLYPFEMSTSASARVISQVNTLNSMLLPPQRRTDPANEQLGIGDTVQNRLRDFTAVSSSFNHLNGQISTLLKALNGQIVDYQSESFSDGANLNEVTRIFTADSVITMSLSMDRLSKNYKDGFITVEKLLTEEQLAARNKFMSSVKHPDKEQQESVASQSRSGEMIARISVGDRGKQASSDELALLHYLRSSVDEVMTERWNTARDFALRAVSALDVKDLDTLSFIDRKEFTDRFPGLVGSVQIDKVAKVSLGGADVYAYQSEVTVDKEPRYEVLVSPTATSVSLAVKEGIATSRFPAWTTELTDEEKEKLFNKLYATDQTYSDQIEARRNEVAQRTEIFSFANVEEGRIITPKHKGRAQDFRIKCTTESYGDIIVHIPPLQDTAATSEPRRARVTGNSRQFQPFSLTVEQTEVVQQQLSRRLGDLVRKQLNDLRQETKALNGKGLYNAQNWTETVENGEGTKVLYGYSGHSQEWGEASVTISSVSAGDGNVTYSGVISGSGISSQSLGETESRELFERLRAVREASQVRRQPRPIPRQKPKGEL